MASLGKSRRVLHFLTFHHPSRVCSPGMRGSNIYKEVGFWVAATSNYHTGVNRRLRGCVVGVGSARLAAPHLSAALLSPPHLTPQHRHLSSVTSAFQKMFIISAASPQSGELLSSSTDTTTFAVASQITQNAPDAQTNANTVLGSPGLDSATIPMTDITAESMSATQAATESIVYIPPPPAPPEILEPALNALGEPTFESLGLNGWTPVGIMETCLEHLHVTADLPWWGAIAVATVILRTLIFPLVLKSQKNVAKMNNCLPQLQVLQMKMSEARNSGDYLNATRYGQEMSTFMKEKDLSPLKNIIVPLAQAPIFISMFISLRKLSNLPLESFKDGGVLWFSDLTVCDPYYVLPVITSITMLATIELGTDGTKVNSQNMHLMKYVLRALPLFILPFTIDFPAAVLCYWVSTNFFSLAQVGFLRIPAVRDYFKIERMVTHKKETMPKQKGFVVGIKDSWRNMQVAREIGDRARHDEVMFRKAGAGPLVPTYKHDPTKIINVQAKVRDDK